MEQGQCGGGVGKCALTWVCVCETTFVAMTVVCVYRRVELSVHRCVFIQPGLETDSERDVAVHTHSLTHVHPQGPPLLSAQDTLVGKALLYHP